MDRTRLDLRRSGSRGRMGMNGWIDELQVTPARKDLGPKPDLLAGRHCTSRAVDVITIKLYCPRGLASWAGSQGRKRPPEVSHPTSGKQGDKFRLTTVGGAPASSRAGPGSPATGGTGNQAWELGRS